MKMKRVAATILSGAMAVSFAACGGGDRAGEGAKSAAADANTESAGEGIAEQAQGALNLK
ncbi:MAG: hypothetical protein ACXAHE_25200 [Roseburia sp. 1XD42-69]